MSQDEGSLKDLAEAVGCRCTGNKGNAASAQAAPGCLCESTGVSLWLPLPGLGRIREERFFFFLFFKQWIKQKMTFKLLQCNRWLELFIW